jgi:hypothetical protein
MTPTDAAESSNTDQYRGLDRSRECCPRHAPREIFGCQILRVIAFASFLSADDQEIRSHSKDWGNFAPARKAYRPLNRRRLQLWQPVQASREFPVRNRPNSAPRCLLSATCFTAPVASSTPVLASSAVSSVPDSKSRIASLIAIILILRG